MHETTVAFLPHPLPFEANAEMKQRCAENVLLI